jgi:glycosyltransferase involved in cell wall biosynthesis
MRIAVLGIRGFPGVIGGPEAHAENLYPYLAANQCEVIVFTRKQYVDSKTSNYKGVRLVPLICIRNKYLEAWSHTLLGVFAARRVRPAILHIHAIGPSLFVPLARLLGMKVIMTHHGPDYEREKWGKLAKAVLKLGERLGSNWANRIICVSPPIGDMIRSKYEKQVAVIPNGVNIPEVAGEQFLKEYGLEKGRYILAVGRFVPEKGFHDLIEGFRLLKGRLVVSDSSPAAKKWKLVIVGSATHEDAYSKELRDKAARDPGIVLTGFLHGSPLEQAYSNAGLFVLPSYYEGLPIVLLEAMSHGLPCVVSDITANRNVQLPERSFFKPGDARELADKIFEFMLKPLDENEKASQIRMIMERHDWKGIAEKTLGVYRDLLADRK